MNITCPNSFCACPKNYIRDGSFWRRDDSKTIQRYRCKTCGTRFSSATLCPTYRQKKRRVNHELLKFLSSGVSMRRSAILLKIGRPTVERKLKFLGIICRSRNKRLLRRYTNHIHNIQIDDLITKENSKLKPLSVSIAVDEDRRLILAAEVSQIPSFGHLAKLSVNKYGKREDKHLEGLQRMFKKIAPHVACEVVVKSDDHQRYPGMIAKYFPQSTHQHFLSERGCVVGQSELKKVRFDPLFVVNHTCAMLRANINRLMRKTWCTTKDPSRLKDHLDIFIFYYNHKILSRYLTPL